MKNPLDNSVSVVDFGRKFPKNKKKVMSKLSQSNPHSGFHAVENNDNDRLRNSLVKMRGI